MGSRTTVSKGILRAGQASLEIQAKLDALARRGRTRSSAGPLHSIVTTGGCAYVYARNDAYFTGVDDPATLRTRLQEWYDDMARGIDRFVPASADEAEDLATMRHFASEMWACAEVAWEIERVRWEAARR